MDWGAILLLLALVTVAGLYLAMPLLQQTGRAVSEAEQTRSVLVARREQVLDALAELEFDHETGKMSETHYEQRKQKLMQEAAAILKKLDALQPQRPAADAVERLIQQRAQRRRSTPPPTANDEIETLLAARRRARAAQKPAGFCPQCGAPVLESDRFCPRCGAPLAQ